MNLFDKLAMNPNLKKKMKGVGGCRKVRNFFFDTMAKNPDIKKKTVYFSFFLGVGGGGRVAGCLGWGVYFNTESTSVKKIGGGGGIG